jgi:putative glutamine amidotransferase
MVETSKRPVIGILASILSMQSPHSLSQERDYINHEYVTSILKADAVPVLLPILNQREAIRRQVELVDGILISGGYDVYPLLYGEEPHIRLEGICPERDEYEIEVIKIADQLKKPILGICRGLQILNVAFGGTLYQDLSLYEQKIDIQHSQKSRLDIPFHTVDLIPNTKLCEIFGESFIVTNSSHHQAVKKLAPGFIVNAKAKDQLIEGIEKPDSPFVLGVQWHPEMMTERHPIMMKLFNAFVLASRRGDGN